MKRKIIPLAITVCFGFMMISAAAAAEVRIGFVNISHVMKVVPQAKRAKQTLEHEFSGRDRKLTASRKTILRLQDKLQKNGDIMSDDKRDDLQREILRRKRDFNRKKDDLKEDFNMRRNEELGNLQKKVQQVIVDLAKQEHYDLLVTERVLYASNQIDITNQVISRLKSAYRRDH